MQLSRSAVGSCISSLLPQPAYRRVLCPQLVSRRNSSVARVSTRDSSTPEPQDQQELSSYYAYEVAILRLQSILSDARANTQDVLRDEVADYPVEAKMTAMTNAGTFVMMIAIGVCWICGEDPLGGMTLSESSMEAALVGMGFGVPLVLCSALSRTPAARSWFPVLDDLHNSQDELLAPLVEGLTAPQALILLTFLVLPLLMTLLPAAKASLLALVDFVSYTYLRPWAAPSHVQLQHDAAILLPAIISAFVAGFFIMLQLQPKAGEWNGIRDALQSSDRYFRLTMAMDSNSNEQESKQTAEAFKDVALLWLLARQRVAQLGYILTMLNVTYYGMIWQRTDDLATPAAAAFMAGATELYFAHRALRRSAQ